jgi:hypothetical protein
MASFCVFSSSFKKQNKTARDGCGVRKSLKENEVPWFFIFVCLFNAGEHFFLMDMCAI